MSGSASSIATLALQTALDGSDAIGVKAVKASAAKREYPDATYPGGFRVETDDGDTVPRGATAMTLGAGLGIDDFDDVATLGSVCDRLGMDVISAGNAVAWAIRATDVGHVDLEVSFGDADAAATLIERIATRAGPVADALVDGVSVAAERYGGEDFVPAVKSMPSCRTICGEPGAWHWRTRRATGAAVTVAHARSSGKYSTENGRS